LSLVAARLRAVLLLAVGGCASIETPLRMDPERVQTGPATFLPGYRLVISGGNARSVSPAEVIVSKTTAE